jgi:hypothetical protein
MKIDRKQIRYSLQLLLHLRKNTVANGQDGYAMLITAILAILMFSMLSVYLFSANLYKSVANSVVDSGSTFYASESGMNKRANLIRDRFEGFSQPAGTEPTGADVAAQMQNCINSTAGSMGSGDLICNETAFDYKESRWKTSGTGDNNFQEEFANNPNVKYRAYSFVKRITTDLDPTITRIPPGEDFAGLNMQEYKYRLYATALKKTGGTLVASAQTLLQMDFNSRVIPLFQFAAFYQGNLEVSSSSNMSLNGPVHSNSSIYYGPGGTLTVGQTTAVGAIYKSLIAAGCTSGTDYKIQFAVGGAITTSCAASDPMTPTEISDRNGLLKNSAAALNLPVAGFLDTTGEYFTKADLQVTFNPTVGQGFRMTSIRRTAVPGAATIAVPNIFTNEMLRSLKQPVMLVAQPHGADSLKNVSLNTTEWRNLCAVDPSGINGLAAGTIPGNGANFTNVATGNTIASAPVALSALTFDEAKVVSNALRRAIAKYDAGTPLKLSDMQRLMTNPALATLKTKFDAELNRINSAASLSVAKKNTLLLGAITPQQIANRAGNCFLPPPMRVLDGQVDRQEQKGPGLRPLNILQANIHSLTVWNRDGEYAVGAIPAPTDFAIANDTAEAVGSANGSVFALAAIDAAAPAGSYAWMGMAASDTTERGLVWHSAVDAAIPAAQRGGGLSEYGFGFSGGRWLPGPLTIATDQIAYIQGDLNNPGGLQPTVNGDTTFVATDNNGRQKRPAAVMADAITVLSNNCVGNEGEIDCLVVPAGGAFRDATRTTVNAAFLSGTSTGGGLNNYMRMLENWHYGRAGTPTATSENLGATIFRYRGSFVSLGGRTKVSGQYRSGCSNGLDSATCYYNVPARDFGFDATFNSVGGLPPLSPQAVYLKQKVFRRDYDNNRS